MTRICMLFFVCSMCCGCTHLQLKKSTTQQTRTVSDIYYNQVLDNLAMICADPEAMPHFAVVAGGVTQITDSAGGSVGLAWNPTTLIGETLGINGNRGITENWSLAPVTDPKTLKKMQNIYRYVASGEVDPDIKDEHLQRLSPDCWFETGKKPLLSKCCEHSGEYCGTHIWVPYEYNMYLTELSLVILEIATDSPPTVEVTQKVDPINGRVIERIEKTVEAYSEVRAVLPSLAGIEKARKEQEQDSSPKPLRLQKNFFVPRGGQGLQFVPSN